MTQTVTVGNYTYTGPPEYLAGAILPHTARDQNNIELFDQYRERLEPHLVANVSAGFGVDLATFHDRAALEETISCLMEVEWENLDQPLKDSTTQSRYFAGVYYSMQELAGWQRDKSLFELYMFQTLDFVRGLQRGIQDAGWALEAIEIKVLDTTNFTLIN